VESALTQQSFLFAVSSAAVSELVGLGATAAASAGDAVKGVDAVVTMLPSSPHVRAVYTDAVFKNAAANTLCIDCSTIDPNTTSDLSKLAAAAGVRC
jgi:3-hydroxyisobutyrate dehydrogenase